MEITETKKLLINLKEMPSGDRYEDTYGGYMDIFERVAKTPLDVTIWIEHCPASWAPLMRYLGANITNYALPFEHCKLVADTMQHFNPTDRVAVENLCGFRPECVDALWKCDMQWAIPRGHVLPYHKEFIVTNNGSFHRAEVLEFMQELDLYETKAKGIIIVPCAADKPYPSPLHKEVLEMLPPDWELAVATGVLGIVPMAMWEEMPWYDSGIPNEWRLTTRAQEFFNNNRSIKKAVCYIDFYGLALQNAFDVLTMRGMCPDYYFVNEVKFYADYIDLMEVPRLQDLQEVISDALNS